MSMDSFAEHKLMRGNDALVSGETPLESSSVQWSKPDTRLQIAWKRASTQPSPVEESRRGKMRSTGTGRRSKKYGECVLYALRQNP